jgi:hypothetical protein
MNVCETKKRAIKTLGAILVAAAAFLSGKVKK